MTADGLEWVTNQPADVRQATLAQGETLSGYKRWRSKFVEGEPQATSAFTADQLREIGMIGLYRTTRHD